MPPKTRVIAGAIVTAAAMLVFWVAAHWITTRIFEPVNTPIPLEAERFETNFRVNLREDYYMQIDLDDSPDDWANDDTGKCNRYRLREVNWKVFRLRRSQRSEELWAEPETSNSLQIFWGGFHAVPGTYRFELEIPRAVTCLNARHPRLVVSTPESFYSATCGWIELISVLLGCAGALLAVRGMWQWLLGLFFSERPLRIFPEIPLRNVTRAVRHRPLAAIASLNNLGVAWIAVLSAIIVIFYWFLIRPYPQHGIAVDFRGPSAAALAASPWTETLSVYVDGQGRFYVNGKSVERSLLTRKLREELGRRMVWTVYVEAALESNFQETVYVMDTIEGLGGKAVWITPKTRKEWEKSGKGL